jgi:large subunit ribosomal protein L10
LFSARDVGFGHRVVQPVPSRRASVDAKHILSGARTVGLNRQEKAAKVEEVGALVAAAQTIVVAEYRGLDVESVTKLRKQARSQGVQLRVLKNTLARRAVTGTAFSGLSDKLVGPLVYGFSADPVAAAKVLAGFAKDNDKLVVKAGAMPNYVMDEKGVKALATMPSREELLAKLMATMQAPIGQFVRTLNEVPSRLVRTLAAVRDAKEGATA